MYFRLQMVIFQCHVSFQVCIHKKTFAQGNHGKTWLSCDKPVGVFSMCFYLKAAFFGINWKRKVSRYPNQKGWHPNVCQKDVFEQAILSHPAPWSVLRHHVRAPKVSLRGSSKWGVGKAVFFRAKDHQGPNVFFQLMSGKRSKIAGWKMDPYFCNRVNTSTLCQRVQPFQPAMLVDRRGRQFQIPKSCFGNVFFFSVFALQQIFCWSHNFPGAFFFPLPN